MPSLRDFGHVGILCTFSNIVYQQQQQLGLPEARSLAAPWKGRRTVRHGMRCGPPITVQIIATHPSPPAWQGRTACPACPDRSCWAASFWQFQLLLYSTVEWIQPTVITG